ncbi:acyl-CoA dehydrogenase family protein [Sphingobium aquiterrae]|uniref:acyl-CoA dehydrogenase family protein n=1 Tax=Sphingobium aquiterrae TaxID=2038656 RepID=UPI0030194DEA
MEIERDREDVRDLIADTANGIFAAIGPLASDAARSAGESVSWFASGWDMLVENGFVQAMRSEDEGGVGVAAALMIVRLSGAAALNLPLAEAMGADWLLASAGLPPAGKPTVFASGPLAFTGVDADIRLSGTIHDVAWGRMCDLVCMGQLDGQAVITTLLRDDIVVTEALNMADEPRDSITLDIVIDPEAIAPLPDGFGPATPQRLGAVLRAAQLAGAAQAAVDMTIGYSTERKQFGRALSRFQAVQQLVAVMAGEATAATVAVDLAATALAAGLPMEAVAAAKIRSSEAAGKIAAAAHQIHGAIGFTREHALQLLTRRLWSWRNEFGTEFEWATALGRSLAARPEALWPAITDF